MKKRTETVIETHQVQIIRRPRQETWAWCEACAVTALMITPEEAARLAQVTTRTIYRRVEAGELHFTETSEGALFICRDSLDDSKRQGKI